MGREILHLTSPPLHSRPCGYRTCVSLLAQGVSQRRDGGAKLMTLFKTLLAVGKISHTDFCLACFYADKAGCIGGDFQTYALGPGLQSGKYSAIFLSSTRSRICMRQYAFRRALHPNTRRMTLTSICFWYTNLCVKR